MVNFLKDHLLHVETRCSSLLFELKTIWDEIGESEEEREKVLQEIEEERVNMYRRKVEQARHYRAQLKKEIADAEAELASICSAMNEPPPSPSPSSYLKSNESTGGLKDAHDSILPQLEAMRRRRMDRKAQFANVAEQMRRILEDIKPTEQHFITFDDSDLSLRKFDEWNEQLHLLQKEKENLTRKAEELRGSLNSVLAVLGMDSEDQITGISDGAIESLSLEIERAREMKRKRMEKLQDMVITMLELWNLMDTPAEEQQRFRTVACNVAASEDEIVEPNALSLDSLKEVEEEMMRLEMLKISRMKDLIVKKTEELKEILCRAHLAAEEGPGDDTAIESLESVDNPLLILEQLEVRISAARDEFFSRKEILERVEKWMGACEEEAWLEEYNRVAFALILFSPKSICARKKQFSPHIRTWIFRTRIGIMLGEDLISV